jgi:hypothetical protein
MTGEDRSKQSGSALCADVESPFCELVELLFEEPGYVFEKNVDEKKMLSPKKLGVSRPSLSQFHLPLTP